MAYPAYPQNFGQYPFYQQYQQYTQPYQQPTVTPPIPSASTAQGPAPMQQPTPQMMTPPTIHAEIIQVDGEQAANAYPVAVGASQMMISRDETEIYIKTAFANSQPTLDVYVKRPPAPPEPQINTADFVTWKGLEERLAAITAVQQPTPKGKARKAEGDIENESV